MKPKAKQRKKKGGNFKSGEKLNRYMASVKEFVHGKCGDQDTEQGEKFHFVAKKSRKELRKDKRKMKKAKLREKAKKLTPSSVPLQGTSDSNPVQKKETKRVRFDVKKSQERKESHDTERVYVDSRDIMAKERKKYEFSLKQRNKQALMDANVDEDREIKKLEKLLGLNKRRNKQTLPQSFSEDGLDYILGVLESGSAGLDESDDEIATTRVDASKRAEDSQSEMSEEDEEEVDTIDGIEEEDEDEMEEGEEYDDDDNNNDDDDDQEVERMDTIQEVEEEEHEEDQVGNDPVCLNKIKDRGMKEKLSEEEDNASCSTKEEASAPSGKYIPPHLRENVDSKRKIELEKLKKSVKGLINRLSEANLASISGQLEQLYMSCSRKDMTDTLTGILLAACVTPALMPDRLLMEHILLVSVLHYSVGLEVGAQFLETVVRKFDELYQQPQEGKECDNLVAMVAHLYNFQVVHSLLIFDLLKKLVATFSEKDIELVLFLLKTVGFSLRKDDPLALKELINEAQRKAGGVGAKFRDQTRVRFMLETMMALKNNDMRKIPGYDPEPVEKLKKLQKTLIHRSASGSDVKLRVSLDNLLEADQVGRWWIVGSSWSGTPMIGDHGNKPSQSDTTAGQFSSKVLELARKQRMNTDIRRNIFCVIMTSEDYLDAFEKLLSLGLKDRQEREIVHVLMDCCMQERNFNAFYAVLGDKMCAHDRRFQMTFQFSLWDKFKELATLSSNTFSNLVHLVTHFLTKKSLSLSLLKAIEFGELDKVKVKFLRQVLTKLLKETEPEDLTDIFGRISGIPKLGMLREGLKLFISHFLVKSTQAQGSTEQSTLLTERAKVAITAMEAKEAKLRL